MYCSVHRSCLLLVQFGLIIYGYVNIAINVIMSCLDNQPLFILQNKTLLLGRWPLTYISSPRISIQGLSFSHFWHFVFSIWVILVCRLQFDLSNRCLKGFTEWGEREKSKHRLQTREAQTEKEMERKPPAEGRRRHGAVTVDLGCVLSIGWALLISVCFCSIFTEQSDLVTDEWLHMQVTLHWREITQDVWLRWEGVWEDIMWPVQNEGRGKKLCHLENRLCFSPNVLF